MRLIPPVTTVSAVPAPPPAPARAVMVVAIALAAPDRVRVAASVGEDLPLLMVSSVEEALVLLAGLPSASRPGDEGDEMDAAGAVAPIEIAESASAGRQRLIRPLEAPRLEIDSDDRVLLCGDRRVDLTPLEHDVMTCLLPHVGRTWPYGVLNRRVWGSDHQGGRGNVHSVVKRLRHKLGLLDSPLHLDVVRGVGLRLVPARRRPRD